ncbi:MAG: alpha/beta fold hydrolase [Myxococcaceae bacterium]|nr:alpha/beta fold hydrolase [Myxococcaceae bacterium]
MRRLVRVLGTTIAILAVGYLGLVALAFFAQRSLLFPAPPQTAQPSSASRVIELPETVLLVRSPPTPTAPVVLHFHGNGEQLAWTEWMGVAYQQHGVGFVAVEYPGYGLARGKGATSEASIVAAAEAALKYLQTVMGVPNERLIVSGQSLGSGAAVELARRGIGARVVLLTPYTSLPDVAAGALPFLPVRLLMRDRFDSASKAAEVRQPVLIIHGTDDEVVPWALGERLSRLLPSAKLVTIAGGQHNDVASREDVWQVLAPFVLGR